MVNYHRHTFISNQSTPDSTVSNEDYCKRAVELGHKVISSCEHGTKGNIWQCQDLAEKYGLKWRYVAEAYFVKDRLEKDRTNAHIILAAKTAKGVGDLNEALTSANETGFYYHPRVDMDILMRLDPKDVFVTTACIAGVWKYGWDIGDDGSFNVDFDEPDRIVRQLWSHFKGSMMLEVQAHDDEKQKVINRHVLDLYRKEGIPLICGLDSHYIYPEQAFFRDHLIESKKMRYNEESNFDLDYPDDDTVYRRFLKQGVLSPLQIQEAMSNTDVFLSFDDVVLDKSKKMPVAPKYQGLTQEERNEKYRELVRESWRQFRSDVQRERWPEYLDGIKYEVDTITSTNTSDYFLIDYEMVKEAKANGGIITRTGRGSCGGFATNTLLGFSSIDRFALPVTLYPDRFISADRLASGSFPDLDLNVGNEEVFAEAQAKVMGPWHSARMITYNTFQRSAAWKMYAKAEGVPYETANEVSGMLKKYEVALKHADEGEQDEINVFDYVPEEYRDQLIMSEKYMGIIVSYGQAPCSYILYNGDLRREIGLVRMTDSKTGKPYLAAEIDGATAERYGFLKNDILHVDVVKVNAEIYRRIGIEQPSVHKLLQWVSNDKATWKMYANGYTKGLNQVEQEKTTERVMKYKPKNISELSAFVAAIRPGFKSMLDVFLSRRHFEYGIPALDRLIQTQEMPDSFLTFQEQVMTILQKGGLTAPESYAAIKAISKKKVEKILALKDKFSQEFSKFLMESGVHASEVSSATEKVWTIINDSTSYLFNAAHAVAVALDSLYTAWAKAHYPLETYACLIENYLAKGQKDKIDAIKQEMKKAFGITITHPRFGQDNRTLFLDHEHKTISDSLVSIKNVSKTAANALYHLGQRHYDSFVDLLYEMTMDSGLNARVIEILIRLDYFSEFGRTGKLLAVWREFTNGEAKFSKSHIKATQLRHLDELRRIEKEMPDTDIPTVERASFEISVLGTPVTVDKEAKGLFAVVDLDTKYSPKATLYNIAAGTTGKMKIRKPVFNATQFDVGDVIRIDAWEKKQAMKFVDGKAKPNAGVYDLWLKSYGVVYSPKIKE